MRCIDQIHLFQPQWLMSVFARGSGEAKEGTILLYTGQKSSLSDLHKAWQEFPSYESKVVTAANGFNLGKILDPGCNVHRLLLNTYDNKQKVST